MEYRGKNGPIKIHVILVHGGKFMFPRKWLMMRVHTPRSMQLACFVIHSLISLVPYICTYIDLGSRLEHTV